MKTQIMERPDMPVVKIAVSGDDDEKVTAIYTDLVEAISQLDHPGTVILTRRQ